MLYRVFLCMGCLPLTLKTTHGGLYALPAPPPQQGHHLSSDMHIICLFSSDKLHQISNLPEAPPRELTVLPRPSSWWEIPCLLPKRQEPHNPLGPSGIGIRLLPPPYDLHPTC